MLTIGKHYNYNLNQPSKVRTTPKFGEANNQPCQPYPQAIKTDGSEQPKKGLLANFGDIFKHPENWYAPKDWDESANQSEDKPTTGSNYREFSYLA